MSAECHVCEDYAEWLDEINEVLGVDRERCAFVDDAVRLVVVERDRYRQALAEIERRCALDTPDPASAMARAYHVARRALRRDAASTEDAS